MNSNTTTENTIETKILVKQDGETVLEFALIELHRVFDIIIVDGTISLQYLVTEFIIRIERVPVMIELLRLLTPAADTLEIGGLQVPIDLSDMTTAKTIIWALVPFAKVKNVYLNNDLCVGQLLYNTDGHDNVHSLNL